MRRQIIGIITFSDKSEIRSNSKVQERTLTLCVLPSEFGQSLKKREDVKQLFTTAH